jgi:two-component sensor histidine kinase
MNATTGAFEARALRSSRDRIAEMIAKHPRLSEQETRQVLDFMKTARHLEIGLLTSNQKLRPKLDAFMEEHKHHFQVSVWEAAVVIGAILAFVVVSWLFWEVARPLAGG